MACNQVINPQKMATRNAFFRSLGYSYIFSTASSQRTRASADLRLDEMKELPRKLHVIGENGIGDATVWRLWPFEDIWAKKLNTSSFTV